MPRRKRLRKVVAPPGFKSFKPHGLNIKNTGEVDLLYEEYEAIKLADYDLLKHLEASKLMGISRATFARIYESARRKIAKALVERKEIKAVYGDVYFDKDWYLCESCHARFTLPIKEIILCPVCKSKSVNSIIQ
jgi:uncharacterized protein